MRDLAHLLATLITIETFLIGVRVLLSWVPGLSYRSPWVRGLALVVDPVLAPFRRVIPAFGGVDVSPLVAIVVLDEVRNALDDYYVYGGTVSASYFVVDILAHLVRDLIVFCIVVLVVRLLLDLFNTDPFHPLVRLVRQASRPLITPFAAVAPRSRQVDIAAVVSLVCFIVLLVIADDIFSTILRHLGPQPIILR